MPEMGARDTRSIYLTPVQNVWGMMQVNWNN